MRLRPVLLLLFTLLPASLAAQQLSNERTAAPSRDFADVLDSGRLVVAVYADFAPYSFEEDGVLKGIDVEIARGIAGELGLEPQFLVRQAGETVDDDLRVNIWKGDLEKKVADVMMHVPNDSELEVRSELAVICCTYYEERFAVLVDSGALPEVETFARFVHRPIAVENDSVADFFLTGAFRGQLQNSIRRGRTFDDAMAAFVDGEVDAIMAPRTQLDFVASRAERETAVFQPPMPGIVRASWPVGLAVKENSRDLVYPLDDAIQALIDSGRMQEIFAEYGARYEVPPR